MAQLAGLLLADGRFPCGQHSHSGGLEVAVRGGSVRTVEDVVAYARGRATTSGLVDAAVAAWVVGHVSDLGAAAVPWAALDAHVSARMTSAAQRATSRALGAQLAHTASRVWPSPLFDAWSSRATVDPHLSVALGVSAAAAGLSPRDAAFHALYATFTTVTTSALRLLGLDPVALARALAATDAELVALADAATAAGRGPLDDLPSASAPACELAAEAHEVLERRLFAS